MTVEINPIEKTVDTFLESLDEPLGGIRELLSRTDVDFIDEDGHFNPNKKLANYGAISGAIGEFNRSVNTRDIFAIAKAAGVNTTAAVALVYETNRSIKLKDWRYIQSTSRLAEPLPIIPESVIGSRQALLDTAEKVEMIVDWWSGSNPYFITYRQADHGDIVTVYPSKGTNNIVIDQGNRSTNHNPSIHASFNGGRRVSLKGEDGQLTWIDLAGESIEKFSWPLLGYHDFHAAPEDFLGPGYSDFAIAGANRVDLVKRTSAQRFAARVALDALISGSEAQLPVIGLSAPNSEYSAGVVDFLASSTIDAFLPPRMDSTIRYGGRSSGVRSVDVRAAPNLVRSSSLAEIRMYLRAAGAGIMDLVDTTSQELSKMSASTLLGGRIDAIKAQSSIDTFFDSL